MSPPPTAPGPASCPPARCPSALATGNRPGPPDGTQLAVSTDLDVRPGQPPRRFGIAIIDLAKRTERTVVENPFAAGQNHFARWSPDGRRLVFWRSRERVGGVLLASRWHR